MSLFVTTLFLKCTSCITWIPCQHECCWCPSARYATGQLQPWIWQRNSHLICQTNYFPGVHVVKCVFLVDIKVADALVHSGHMESPSQQGISIVEHRTSFDCKLCNGDCFLTWSWKCRKLNWDYMGKSKTKCSFSLLKERRKMWNVTTIYTYQ